MPLFLWLSRLLSRLAAWFLLALIALYKYGISPILPQSCRYFPSCSAYAKEAVCKHGPYYGGFLTVKRLLRCHPWGGHGIDPVP